MIEHIKRDEIETSLKETTRQYLVGNLQRPQRLRFLRSEALEVGITRYLDHAEEVPHWHTEATEYQYVISGWTSYLDTNTGEDFHFTAGDFYAIFPGTSYAQKSKPGTQILFIKVPSIDDKNLAEITDDVEAWMSRQLRTVRTDYYHDPEAPNANSVRPAAAVAVVREGQVLLVRRKDNGKWTLPGGTLEMNESLPRCAVREVKEETSLDVEITDILGTYTDPGIRIAYSDGEVRREFTIVYLATTTSSEVCIDSESSEYRWFAISALDTVDVAQSQRKRLEDLVRYFETGEKRYA
ncbi:NUDIX domain-containing protein [Corynebacterium pelargi]|uniref:Nucleoside triphosphatase NudI n=1 Tax=Corynebacterium pelargi TaxID=1471400 RepID=A0A410WBG8_9CORY|nr:NUDIX domain-containing protein [Corynebacterium pelargi]QAU53274.1 Nucleoside triphosphatase NudI [Corynebacterium pelargi]GGG73629.1 hypothetical protein GCM10007338_08630 [Corynebacterium pelargi]